MQRAGIINIEEVLKEYPYFEYNSERRIISGYLNISENDRYNVEIHLNYFPDAFPVVFEMDERIPVQADRHTNKDGSLCFTTKPNEVIYIKTIVKSLTEFIELILTPYLQNNSYYEINKRYKFDEYSHYQTISTYQTYSDILDIIRPHNILRIINERIKLKKKYRPNDLCYCNSNVKIKKCKSHEKNYKNFSKLDKHTLERDIKLINDFIEDLNKFQKSQN